MAVFYKDTSSGVIGVLPKQCLHELRQQHECGHVLLHALITFRCKQSDNAGRKYQDTMSSTTW